MKHVIGGEIEGRIEGREDEEEDVGTALRNTLLEER